MSEQIRQDFDCLARLSVDDWDHNSHYHSWLLRYVPAGCERALDVGCGTGVFARALAGRCRQVMGVDLSPEMIAVAQQRSTGFPELTYVVQDVLAGGLEMDAYDCIASIATLHHLPLETALHLFRRALRPGGVLLVLDLYRAAGLDDFVLGLAAAPVGAVLRLAKTGRLRDAPEVRRAWAAHARHDHYASIQEIRAACSRVLPGAAIRRHLLWRYSLIWQKPC